VDRGLEGAEVICDVAVVGGGPGGTATVLSLKQLRPSLRVIVVEASRYDSRRVGETLSPGCLQLIESLGCGEHFRAERFMESFGTQSAWGNVDPYDNEFLFSTHGTGWHVDRSRFDALLAECAERAGATVLRESRLIASEWVEGRWKLGIRRSKNQSEVEARFVVDATGRAASFATQQGVRRIVADRLAGVFMSFRFPAGCAPRDTRTLVEAAEDGWWYSSIMSDSSAIVAWMSDADLIRSGNLSRAEVWMRHLARSRFTSARVASGEPEMSVEVRAAQSQMLMQVTGPGWIAAGDAASTFDPLSSQGILKALRSGKLASFVTIDCLEGRPESRQRYEKLIAGEFEQYLAGRAWYYDQEGRWPESPFWSRRHSRREAA
jgi:flavin-dependent dehydrogenase